MNDVSRELDIRINAATEVGFAVWEAGRMVASVTSAAEVAEWIERRLRTLPGEREREAQDMADTLHSMPNVIRAQQGDGLWRRK